MTCPDCQCAVNVPMHNGASFRCGCGKTIFTLPVERQRPKDVDLYVDLTDLLKLMRDHKAVRVTTPLYTVELSPEAFAPQWPAQSSSLGNTEEKQCRCGHSLEVEHNDAGLCLQGCEPDACAEKAAA